MRKLILFIGVALMVGCAPGKSGEFVKAKIYCDSCHVKIANEWHMGNDKGLEIAFDSDVVDSAEIDIERFKSDYPCIRLNGGQNYSTGQIDIFFYENNILIGHDVNGTGFCY